MNWVRASRLHELNDITNDYIESLNMHVMAIAFTGVSDADMERFCDRFIGKYPNLDLWHPDTPYYGRGIKAETLDICMDKLEERLRTQRGKFYLLGVYVEPDKKISIKYSKVLGGDRELIIL